MATFAELTAVTALDSHTYQINLPDNWCIGSVPHGGATTACFLAAAREHFLTTLEAQNQPDCLILHLEFARRTSAGPAIIHIKDFKLGRQTSTIQATLVQGDRDEVVGYITHCNIGAETGLTLPTSWEIQPKPPAPDLEKLRSNSDPNWDLLNIGLPAFRKASVNVNMFLPRNFRPGRGIIDQWIQFKNGERFNNLSLGYVSDMFPQMAETYATDKEALAMGNLDPKQLFKHWYPTLALNLDVKKRLPEDGVEFLFVRVRSKQIKNGRKDLEVIIMDEAGEIVALSHHVAMIVSAERNFAARSKGKAQEADDQSKL